MKSIVLVFLFTICLLEISFSQKLTYTYPYYVPQYPEEIERVEKFTETINRFDTTTISAEYQITSEPVKIRKFKNGKIISSGYKHFRREYKYDDDENIKSLTHIRNENITIKEYIINQEKLKIEIYRNKKLEGEQYFDSQFRMVCSIWQPRSNDSVGKMINTYDDHFLIKREYYSNDELTHHTTYTYEEGKLKYTNYFYKDNFRYKEEVYSYFPGRNETAITIFRRPNARKLHFLELSYQASPVSRKIEFFDNQNNLIKSYLITEYKFYHTAKIKEYRLYTSG